MIFNRSKDTNTFSPDSDPEEIFETDIVDQSTPLPDHPDVPKDLTFIPIGSLNGRLQQMPTSGISQLTGRNDAIGKIARNTIRGINNANKIRAGLSSGDMETFVEGVQDAAAMARELAQSASKSGTRTAVDVLDPKPPGGGIRAPGSGTSYSGSGHAHLSITPDPTHVTIDTGIPQFYMTPDYNNAVSGYASFCYSTNIKVALPTISTTDLGYYTQNSVVNDLRQQIARNVNFNTSTIGSLTTANLILYFNNIIAGLSVYYCMKRYAVWGINSIQKNDSLYYMRSSFSPTDVSNYYALERLLDGLPIPAKLNEWLFWLFQLYSSGGLPNDPVLTIDSFSLSNGIPQWSSDITNAITALNTDTMFAVSNVLARAFPKWLDTTLLNGTPSIKYDEHWLTLWRNLPYQQSGSSPVTHDLAGPPAATSTTDIRYNTWCDDLDGSIPGLIACNSNGTSAGTWLPSLITPNVVSTLTSGNLTNRYHFLNTGSTSTNGWYDSYVSAVAFMARDETYNTNSSLTNSVNVALVAGSERLITVCVQTSIEPAEALVDYWLSWDTIPTKSDKSLDSTMRKTTNAYRRINKRGKDKGKKG